MIEFAHTFLLVFGQIAVGGIFALSIPSEDSLNQQQGSTWGAAW
jgi:hypothetical protein